MPAAFRPVSVLILLVLIAGALAGCTRSIQGTWVRQDGTELERLNIDDEWMTFNGSDEFRYEIDGKTSIRVVRDGAERELRWSREGDTLTLDGVVYHRSGSKDAQKGEAKATEAAACEAERERLLAGELPSVAPDCPYGGGQYEVEGSYYLPNAITAVHTVTITCRKHGASSAEKP